MRIPCHHILSEITPQEQCKQAFQQLILVENAVTRTAKIDMKSSTPTTGERERDTHKQRNKEKCISLEMNKVWRLIYAWNEQGLLSLRVYIYLSQT